MEEKQSQPIISLSLNDVLFFVTLQKDLMAYLHGMRWQVNGHEFPVSVFFTVLGSFSFLTLSLSSLTDTLHHMLWARVHVCQACTQNKTDVGPVP